VVSAGKVTKRRDKNKTFGPDLSIIPANNHAQALLLGKYIVLLPSTFPTINTCTLLL
jgi:hypothetical protein